MVAINRNLTDEKDQLQNQSDYKESIISIQRREIHDMKRKHQEEQFLMREQIKQLENQLKDYGDQITSLKNSLIELQPSCQVNVVAPIKSIAEMPFPNYCEFVPCTDVVTLKEDIIPRLEVIEKPRLNIQRMAQVVNVQVERVMTLKKGTFMEIRTSKMSRSVLLTKIERVAEAIDVQALEAVALKENTIKQFKASVMHYPGLNILQITQVNVKVECAISLNEKIFQQLKASIEIRSASLTKVQRVTRVKDAPTEKAMILTENKMLNAPAKIRPALLNKERIQQTVMEIKPTEKGNAVTGVTSRDFTDEEKSAIKNRGRRDVIRSQKHRDSLQKDVRFSYADRTSQDWRSKSKKIPLTSIFVQGELKSMKTTLPVSNANQHKQSKRTYKQPTYENGHHFPCTEELWD